MNQQYMRKQNKILKTLIEGYMVKIHNLKQTNEQHQAEIQTLLKFNERLLTIIETELSNYNKKSERSLSLQPISQITERESETVEHMGPIKNQLFHGSLKLSIPSSQKKERKETGHETDRVISDLGGLQDKISYEVNSRSSYSESSQKQKYKQIMNLISMYKQEYGQTIQQCEKTKTKIKSDGAKSSQMIQDMNEENTNFYGAKIQQLCHLKQKLQEENPQKQLERMMKSNKYSARTQNRLRQILGNIH